MAHSRSNIYEIFPPPTLYNIHKNKSYGVGNEEIKILPSGAKAHYVGEVKFLGQFGWFGKYRYVGRYRDFKLIKIVNPDGSITTPTCLGIKM